MDVSLDDVNFETNEYNKWVAYARSKSANVHFAKELANRLGEHGVSAFSVHPGGLFLIDF